MRMYYLRIGLALSLVLLSATVSLAETFSLSVTVYDPSGAVIGGAAVKAVHDATGDTFTQITNEAGLNSFSSIAVRAGPTAIQNQKLEQLSNDVNVVTTRLNNLVTIAIRNLNEQIDKNNIPVVIPPPQ